MNQNTALKILKTGKNVFVTGSAGTGKTYLLGKYIKYLRDHNVFPDIVAPTGIAASHLGGQTIHSFFGIGIREEVDAEFVATLTERRYLKKRFGELRVLIIDEISMVSPALLTSMDMILRSFKNTDMPFGGVQVIVSGDFFQLPPVSVGADGKRFAWQSPVWRDLHLESCYLDEKHRQEDERLISILDDIRTGHITSATGEMLASRMERGFASHTKLTRLYTHNIDVDRINQDQLDRLESKPRVYVAHSKGNKKHIEMIFRSSLVMEELVLKKGALVMFVKNNPESGYFNGTTGIVEDFDASDGSPIVKSLDGVMIKVGEETWSLEDEYGSVTATVMQIPLRLAWAITIHKSQGMTLDAAEIDLSKTFETGQGYVALSRIKSLDGLSLVGLNDMALQIDPLIRHVDSKIMDASRRAQQKLDEIDIGELTTLYDEHIRHLGGSTRRVDSSKYQTSQDSSGWSHKIPAHIKTKKRIAKSDTLVALATARGVGKDTIITHLAKIIEEDPTVDISKYKPDIAMIERVAEAVKTISSQADAANMTERGTIRLKPIYELLDGKVSYGDIRLCLLYIGGQPA